MFQRIWQWLKQLWQRWILRQPPPPAAKPLRQPPNDAECESAFMELLEEVASGQTRGQIQAFLIILSRQKRITEADLVAWLRRASSSWLASPAQHQELGRRMGRLGDIYRGELAEVARDISRQLVVENKPSVQSPSNHTSITPTDTPSALSNHTSITPTDTPSVTQSASTTTPPNSEAVELYNQGFYLLYYAGNVPGALAAFQQALAIAPNYHNAWNGLGDALNNMQRYEEAIAAYERALAIAPNFHIAWNGLGNALNYMQRYEEAIAAFQQALAIAPNEHYPWNGLGNALGDMQRYEEAIAAFQQALAIAPNFHIAWNGLGNALNYMQRYEEAIAAFEQALAIAPDDHYPWNGLGNALGDMQRYEEAIAAFQQALAIAPNFHIAWNGLGNALKGMQRYEEAIAAYDEALRLTKDQFWEAWFNRGWAFFEWNRYQLAIQNWDEGISKYLPTNPDWQIAQGNLHQAKGKAQYLHGRETIQYSSYFSQAKSSYQKALKFLDQPNQLRLEVLQETIPVCRALGDAAASEYLDQGIQILEQLILATPSPAQKLRLQKQFTGFYQLEVDNLVKSGNFPLALTKAEKRKNYCLSWLRQNWIENLADSPTCEQIQQLINPSTYIIYWHVSPAAITTFILRDNQPLYAHIFATDLTSIGADKELYKFETWIKEWKTDYQNYCEPKRSPLAPLKKGGTGKESETIFSDQKPANNSKAPLFKGGGGDLLFKGGGGDLPSKENHPWREKMPARLAELATILHIPEIIATLGNNITQLIIIPHRDLHLLPLESLFSQPTAANLPAITRLPSAQIGIQQLSQTPPPSNSLLLIAQSQGKSNLKFPPIEAAAISQIHPSRQPTSAATKPGMLQELQATDGIFHFSGHAQHNPDNPAASALILANGEEITLLDIFDLDFPSYRLVCLSGCETGITGKLNLIDEFVSLASGFLPKTTYVISTLWRVDDRSSALLTIYFYLYTSPSATLKQTKATSPPAALEEAKKWLRTLTNGKLAQWYEEDLLPLLQQNDCDRTIVNFVARESKRLQRNFAKIDDKPYEHPYHWAGFTIAGQE